MAAKPTPKPKAVVKAKSKLTGADITGQKYNTNIKEEAAKIRLKVKMKEKLTPYEKSVLGSDAAIKRMNTNTTTPKSNASKTLKGDKAIEAIRKRTSPKGVKEYEKGAKKALEKKYPGLYKKSK
jgi:hypothetical protein